MSQFCRVALVLVVAALGACTDHAPDEPELRRVSLPGFSIGLPDGSVVTTSKEAFAGRHEVRLPDPGFLRRLPFATNRRREAVVIVGWSQHGLTNQEHIEALRDLALSAIPNSKILRQGSPAPGSWVVTMAGSQASVTFASRSCEPGFNVDLTLGVNSNADQDFGLATNIIATIVCSVTEANRQHPEPATRLPDNFGRVFGAKTRKFISRAGEGLLVNTTGGDIIRGAEFEQVMRAMVSQSFEVPVREVTTAEVPSARADDRKHRLLRARIPVEPVYVGALWCPNLGITVLTTYTSPQPDDARARDVFDGIYCPDEAMPASPDAKPMLENACGGGDSIACDTLRQAYP